MRHSNIIKWKRYAHLFDRKNIEVRERLKTVVEEVLEKK